MLENNKKNFLLKRYKNYIYDMIFMHINLNYKFLIFKTLEFK